MYYTEPAGEKGSLGMEGVPLNPAERLINKVVVATDPGGTTGWAVVALHHPGLEARASWRGWIDWYSCGQFSGAENAQAWQFKKLAAWAIGVAPTDFVTEMFVLRQFNQSPQLLAPVRMQSKIEYVLSEMNTELADEQQPELAKSSASDEHLANWGFEEGLRGRPHGKDALRHALTYVRRQGQKIWEV